MEFSKNNSSPKNGERMKTFSLICAFTLLTALATSGCGSSEIQTDTGNTSDIVTTETGSPATPGNDPVVDPGPGGSGGGVKPDLGNIAPVDAAVLDEPTTPTPPSGGGGGVDNPDHPNCNNSEPFGNRKKHVEGQTGSSQGEVLDANDCIII